MKEKNLYGKKVLACDYFVSACTEFLGTLIFVFFSTGAVVARSQSYLFEDSADVTRISLTFGFCLAAVVYATSNVSGGHINPAVTLSFMVTRNLAVGRGSVYILSQIAGATAASGLLYACVPKGMHGSLGTTVPDPSLNLGQAFLIEFILTFALIYVVHHVAELKQDSQQFGLNMGKHGALAIGFIVLAGHLFAVPLTGPSMNPARTFGPAVVSGIWDHQYIYWTAHLAAAIIAGYFYMIVNVNLGQHGDMYKRRAASTYDPEVPKEANNDPIA